MNMSLLRATLILFFPGFLGDNENAGKTTFNN